MHWANTRNAKAVSIPPEARGAEGTADDLVGAIGGVCKGLNYLRL